MDKRTSVLLAIAEENLSKILRKALVDSEHNFDVLYDEVMHRRYLYEMVAQYKPKILIVHDKFLPADKITAEERDEEMLGIIREIRMKFDQEVRIVYVCIRDRHDPFLGKIIGLGVYDIFHMGQFSTSSFVNQLAEPSKFMNVSKFSNAHYEMGQYDEELPEEHNKTNEISSSGTANEEDGFMNKMGKVLKRGSKKPPITEEVPEEQLLDNEIVEENIIPLSEEPEDKIADEQNVTEDEQSAQEVVTFEPKVRDVVTFGTVVIAVAGLNPNSGVTTTAVSIAKHLQSISKSVALVELNHSLGFDRIHAFYENSLDLLIDEDEFECEKLHHYKHRVGMKLPEIINQYDYVVMDMGLLSENHPYLNEFKRASLRLVITPAQNWKWFTVDALLKQDPFAQSNYTFLLSTEDKEVISEFKKEFSVSHVTRLPITKNLYDLTNDDNQKIDELLNQFMISQIVQTKKPKINVLLPAAAILLLMAGAFYFL